MDRIFCGNGKKVMDWKIGISVCLDDIPAEWITTAKNGKRYINLDVCEKKGGADKWGKTHSVEVNTWKPDKKDAAVVQAKKTFVDDFDSGSIPF